MTVKEILNQLLEKRAESNINLNNIPPSYRLGAEGNVRAAKDAVERLKKQYVEEVSKTAFIVAVLGENSKEFAKLAEENFGMISLNHEEMFDRLQTALKAKLARDTYTQYEHSTLLSEILNLKAELGIVSLPLPTLNTQESYYNGELHSSMRTVLEKTYGDSLESIYLKKQMTEKALEKAHDGNSLPVVLYNYRGSVDGNFLPRPVQVIDLDEMAGGSQVSLELVKSLLMDVKSKVKKTKKQKVQKELTEQQPEEQVSETQSSETGEGEVNE
ncbi:hypothetical protein EBU95_03830 [bacterium]|nr:hypothetical protein [bacterium]